MQIDRLQAVLRQRTPYEAIDLGIAMARTWRGPIYRAWFPCVVPAYVVIWTLLHGAPFYAFLLLWWLKPLWDRVPLFVVSRALFGEVPRPRVTLAALPRLLRQNLVHALLLYRLDPARAFFLPVLQLEGGDRRTRSRRRAALLRTMAIPAAWLTLLCAGLELVVFAGLLGLVLIMLPARPDLSPSVLWGAFWVGETPLWLQVAIPVASFLATSMVEPLYVSAGFSLYINRRTQLEGWDLELTFRRIAERLTKSGRILAIALALTALFLGAASLAPATALAQVEPSAGEAQTAPAKAESAGEALREVLARPEFPHEIKQKVWRIRDRGRTLRDLDAPTPPALGWLGQLLARGLEALLWVVGGVVLAGLLLLIVSRLRKLGPRTKGPSREPLPKPTVGRLPADEPGAGLPSDVVARARRLIEEGRAEEALGLLYRGALAGLARLHSLVIEEHATEGECLRLVSREAETPLAEFFTALTRAWQEEAYAHRPVERSRLRGLCDGWAAHFEASR